MSADPVVIVSFARTPMGGFQGALTGVKATELGATAVRAAVELGAGDPAGPQQHDPLDFRDDLGGNPAPRGAGAVGKAALHAAARVRGNGAARV